MSKSFRKPYRVKRKRKSILKNRVFWRGILSLVFFGVSFYFFILSPIFRIKEVSISGNPVFYEKIKKMINGKNIFLVDFETIKKETLGKFPKIAQINLKRRLPDKIIGQIEERQPVAIFNQGEEFFFLDKEGVIFENVSDKLGLIVTKPSLIEFKMIGERVLEENIMSSIIEIDSKLKDNLEISIKEASVISEDRLNIKTVEGWEVYFNPKNDLSWQLTKLKAVLDKEIPIEKRKNLEYIDLRFGNLAPYKYR